MHRAIHFLTLGLAMAAGGCQPPQTADVRIVAPDTIEFPAIVAAESFADGGEMAGYHLIVWEGGRAAQQALLRARVTDVQVLDALESLGAQPGDGLRIDTWDERHDEAAEAPDRVIAGPSMTLEVVIPGSTEPLALGDILDDSGGRGFEMRFGGHRDNIPEWHSGCVVCLYSCPGSKVGNASYTVRDFVLGTTHFSLRPDTLPTDGTEVIIRLRIDREDDPA